MEVASSTAMPLPASPVKPTLPQLKTPASAGPVLPSELPRSPHPLSGLLKVEDDIKTPITPPTAYTDFLKALSPAVSTPCTSTSTSTSFSFSDKSGRLTPYSQPSSAGSSYSACNCDSKKASTASATSAPLIPPTPFVRPSLTRTTSSRTPTALRRLRIPQSPYSSINESPRSSTSRSATPKSSTPRSATPRSATPRSTILRSPYSPSSWIIDGKTRYFAEPPRSSVPRAVSVKQVVTRTVTYTRTPLEPAPRGKRRKIE